VILLYTMALNYSSYDVDLAGATFADLLTQTTHIIADNDGFLKFCSRNSRVLKSGGLKDLRVYRGIFNTKYLQGKGAMERASFLAVIAATSVVQTKSRVTRVIKGLDSPSIRTGAGRILGDFRDKRAQTNDIDTFLVINLRTAYPELVVLIRMVNSELQGNTVFADSRGTNVNIVEWARSPCLGQLALDPATQAMHKEYMQYFWTEEVTGAGSGWDADSAGWYDRTTALDLIELPTIGGVVPVKTGSDAAGNANSCYTMRDLTTYATAIRANIEGLASIAAGNPFAGA